MIEMREHRSGFMGISASVPRSAIALLLAAGLSACASGRAPNGPALQAGFPPVGLASSAIWLEERQGNAPRPLTAADIPTATVAAQVAGTQRPVAQPAASIPLRATPTGTVALAAQAFADTCVASLPSMTGARDRLRQVSVRDFGVTPNELSSSLTLTGQTRGDIVMQVAVGAGRAQVNQCAISVRRQDPSAVAQAMVDTVTQAGFALTPVAAADVSQAWAISGAPSGTLLKVRSRRNALGQQLTGVWITWR